MLLTAIGRERSGPSLSESGQMGTFLISLPQTLTFTFRDAATEKHEGPNPNLVKTAAKSPGLEDISKAEHVCYTSQNDHGPEEQVV